MLDWLKKIFQPNSPSTAETVPSMTPVGRPYIAPRPAEKPAAEHPAAAPVAPPQPAAEPHTEPVKYRNSEGAEAYLHRVQEKIQSLADRFASGNINRKQFQELYAHYQSEIQLVEQYLAIHPESDEWKDVINDGQSIMIRRKHATKLIGFSIYSRQSGLPLRTEGQFALDPALFVPMLASYQSATREIFGGEIRSTHIDNGRCLCFIPGERTMLLALFSAEPTAQQLRTLEQAHRLFENANSAALLHQAPDGESLSCPQEYFLTHSF